MPESQPTERAGAIHAHHDKFDILVIGRSKDLLEWRSITHLVSKRTNVPGMSVPGERGEAPPGSGDHGLTFATLLCCWWDYMEKNESRLVPAQTQRLPKGIP